MWASLFPTSRELAVGLNRIQDAKQPAVFGFISSHPVISYYEYVIGSRLTMAGRVTHKTGGAKRVYNQKLEDTGRSHHTLLGSWAPSEVWAACGRHFPGIWPRLLLQTGN